MVADWARGTSREVRDPVPVLVVFLTLDHGCGDAESDFVVAEIDVDAAAEPSSAVTVAARELLAGPAGRSPGAVTAVPADLQLRGTPIAEEGSWYLDLVSATGTIDECTNLAALDQLRRTTQMTGGRYGLPYPVAVGVDESPNQVLATPR